MSIHHLKNLLKAGAGLLIVAVIGGVLFVYSGLFDPGADSKHSTLVYTLLQTMRERGIATRAHGIPVPDLQEPALILGGAGNYDAMCSGCHLKPGVKDSEMHRGLYPQPPALAALAQPIDPERAFWVVKHGIKASGMPAWGKSMDDRSIWGLVAFLHVLPKLTQEDYHEAVELSGGHSHGDGEHAQHDDSDGAAHHHDMEKVAAPESTEDAPDHHHDAHD